MPILAVDAFFSLDAAAEAASAASLPEAAAAALTAGEIGAGAGAGAGLSAIPAGMTQAQAAAMAQGAAAGGEGAAAGINALQQGAITSPVPTPAITSINPTTGVPTSFSPTFDPTSGVGTPPPPPMPAAPPPELSPRGIPPASPGITSAPSPDPYALSKPPVASPYLSNLGDTYSFTKPSVGLADQYAANAGRGTFSGMAEAAAAPAEPKSAFMSGLDKAMDWADAHPKTALAGAYLGAKVTGLLNPNYNNFNSAPYSGPLSKYKLSENYQPGVANPSQFRYTPRYAEGGIMQMAGGGVTASGNLTLNVPIDMGGGQNDTQSTPNFAFGDGNSGANTGFFGQNSTQTGQPSNPQGSTNAPQPSQQDGIMGQQGGTPDLMQSLQQLKPEAQANNTNQQSGSQPNSINVGDKPDVGEMKTFASGGSTGNLSSTLDYYTKMMEGDSTPRIPAQHPEGVGIFNDNDPDTRNLDAYSAARVRQAKANKRAYVTPPQSPTPPSIGQLNLGAAKDTTQYQEAAKGGIMGVSDLGGYAAGGNPRLLKGPGDGMSDNIPATINGRQPARLADGEFVIPADVVSHLGNGSTEAGAKILHQMMTKVRHDRTGNPHQGKQINPNKYMPR